MIPQHHATGTTTGRERSRQASARHHTRSDGALTRITDHVSSSLTVESPNDTDDHGAGIRSPCFWTLPAPVVHRTPDMGVNLWGASPLDENGNLKEGSIPNVTPIDKVLGEGGYRPQVGRGEATNRGKEACEPSTGVAAGSVHAKAARLRTETS